MPRGIAKAGVRMTKQRLEAIALTNPDFVKEYEEKLALKKSGVPIDLPVPPTEAVQELAPHMLNRVVEAHVNESLTTNRPTMYIVGQSQPDPQLQQESDEEILAKLTKRFRALRLMTEMTAKGVNRALIISGPAGLGKSFESEEVLAKLSGEYHHKIVKGFVRPTGLYKMFYEMRHENCVVMFDDADSIFNDDVSLNLLKAACDSNEVRKISWLAETQMETENGQALPREFEFRGSVIFITNYRMDELALRGGRLAPHFEALVSRSQYLDLGMRTTRDYLVRIKMVVREGMLRDRGFTKAEEDTILNYVEQNEGTLRELSLRMVNKVASLIRMSPDGWEDIAAVTLLRQS